MYTDCREALLTKHRECAKFKSDAVQYERCLQGLNLFSRKANVKCDNGTIASCIAAGNSAMEYSCVKDDKIHRLVYGIPLSGGPKTFDTKML